MNLWWVFIKFPRNSLYETMILHGISMNSNKFFRRLTGWFTQMSCPNPWKTKLFEHKQFQYQCSLCLCVVGWNAIYCVPVRVGWWLLVFYIQTRSVNRYRFSLSTHLSHIFVFISHLYTELFVSNCYRVDLMSNCTSNIQNNSRISYNFLSCTGFRLGNDFLLVLAALSVTINHRFNILHIVYPLLQYNVGSYCRWFSIWITSIDPTNIYNILWFKFFVRKIHLFLLLL